MGTNVYWLLELCFTFRILPSVIFVDTARRVAVAYLVLTNKLHHHPLFDDGQDLAPMSPDV
jgi:hypothetical protein